MAISEKNQMGTVHGGGQRGRDSKLEPQWGRLKTAGMYPLINSNSRTPGFGSVHPQLKPVGWYFYP